MFGMWDVWDVGCSGCGMLGMWDVRDVGYSGCGMFAGMWDVDLQNAEMAGVAEICQIHAFFISNAFQLCLSVA